MSGLEGGMRFQILGPLRVHVGDREVAITAPRERVALALLLLHAGETVSVVQLVDAIWPDNPPHTARNQVQASVSRLRRLLSSVGSPDGVIVTELGGYRLWLDRHDVDLHEFRTLLADARTAVAIGNLDEARDRYRAAVGSWRGSAFAGIESVELARVADALEEERIQAYEECLQVELSLDPPGQLVAELTELVSRHPYREGMRGTLMRALYRAGRPAEALEQYERLRRLLRDELGTEPGEQLQRLHKALLNQDPDLDKPPVPPRPTPASPAVRELPAEPSRFVGRDEEIARVRAALLPPDRADHRRPSVVVVYGPGGIGKSALAIRVAHDVAAEYPDGQLYVDLCGSTPGMRPLTPVEVLGRFLRRLGVAPDQIPADQSEAAALFRSLAAERRLLLVLDNTAGVDQVTPLLPGSPTCGVLVTSRHPLASLDADYRLRLGVLADTEGLVLLTGVTNRLASEPEAAQSILALSGGLPLAIRIAAGRLACRPDLSGTEYARRLADRSRRLDEFQLEDLAVRASIRTSYDALLSDGRPAGALAARAFRMLGLLHVPDVAPGVVAAMLSEQDIEVARAALDRLVDAQLLEPFGHGRYRLHDLVRLVATESAISDEKPSARKSAMSRAISYYTGALWSAVRAIQPARASPFGIPTFADHVGFPRFGEPRQANAWIDSELSNLVSALEQVLSHDGTPSQLVVWLGYDLWRSLDSRCEWQRAHEMSSHLLTAAELRNDLMLEGCGLLLYGRSEACLGRYETAKVYLKRALSAMRRLDDPPGAALTLIALGIVSSRCGDSVTAWSSYSEALDLANDHRLGDLAAVVLTNMSVCLASLGRLEQALRSADQSAAISAEMESLDVFASALNNTAAVHCLRGDYALAVRYATRSLALGGQVGHRPTEYESLLTRSEAYRGLGRFTDAIADAQRVLERARVDRYRYVEAAAKRVLSKILAAMGRDAEAAHADRSANEAYAGLADVFRDPMTELVIARTP